MPFEPLRRSEDVELGKGPIPATNGGPTPPSFAAFAARLRSRTGWRYHEIDTGHDAMVTAPDEVAAILAELGRR